MVKYDYKKSAYAFYPSKVTFTETNTGETKSEYTEVPSSYSSMVANNPNMFSDFSMETVMPTDEQKARLDILNTIEEETKGSLEFNGGLFVEYGYITSTNENNALYKYLDTYRDLSISYIKEQLVEKLSVLKDEIETGGVEYQEGYIVQTDAESQSKVTGIFASFSAMPTMTVSFKFANNKFLSLNQEQFTPLALLVSAHVQAAYTAETSAEAYLDTLSLEDLEKYTDTSKEMNNEENKDKTNDIEKLIYSYYDAIIEETRVSLGLTSTSSESTDENKQE